ncbi:hypothetical protein EYF80_035110 [Liparis tanakae]|uniref:Uncharacterized protein n=1 Tax=Liparis tanakae TaxID=230148 RepID=A0A4Z2GMB9_9TELE|nr:hypothetical protein EYF80_035110 [Liparis tanakae]
MPMRSTNKSEHAKLTMWSVAVALQHLRHSDGDRVTHDARHQDGAVEDAYQAGAKSPRVRGEDQEGDVFFPKITTDTEDFSFPRRVSTSKKLASLGQTGCRGIRLSHCSPSSGNLGREEGAGPSLVVTAVTSTTGIIINRIAIPRPNRNEHSQKIGESREQPWHRIVAMKKERKTGTAPAKNSHENRAC